MFTNIHLRYFNEFDAHLRSAPLFIFESRRNEAIETEVMVRLQIFQESLSRAMRR
jgi:hypothetical protein